MKKYDFHTHTIYCDGKDTPRDMVLSAIEKGFCAIGFSGHSYTAFDEEWCMSLEGTKRYIDEINALKDEFSDRISILLGVEQDIFASYQCDAYDYAIGSVHYVYVNGEYVSVDESPESFKATVDNHYNGDAISFAEDYYALVSRVIAATGADVIGHFDLITKFNKDGVFFDAKNERYVKAWQAAVEALIPFNKPFEVNVGAISRGYTNEPYPSLDILKYIKEKGGRVIFSGDCHSVSSLGAYMEEADLLVKEAGFGSMFDEVPILK